MTHPIPPGTRDVLPDEMRELRALTERMRDAFTGAGYGEVHTPALEYEDVLRRGDESAAGARYRTFDEQGDVLALRSDMTIPIARVVASRYADVEPPLRFCYFAHAWRAVDRGVGEPREFMQGGLELIGARRARRARPRWWRLTVAALDGGRACGATGSAWATRRSTGGCWRRSTCRRSATPRCSTRSRAATWWASSSRCARSGSGRRTTATARRGCPSCAAGRACSTAPRRSCPRPWPGLRALHALLAERGVADRVIFDLGLVRELGYYTGAVFEVYDPAVGFTLGGGGRYDELIGRFGRSLPACGDRARRPARAPGAGRRGGPAMSERLMVAVPRGALFDGTLDLLERLELDVSRGARERPQAALRRAGHRDHAPERRADLRGARLGRHRHHRQGRAARAGRPQGLRAARPRLRRAAGWWWPPATAATDRGRAAPARPGPHRHQVPARRRRALREHRPPGGDRGGEGLGGAGPAHRARGRHRGPHRHRAHARGEPTCAWSRRSACARPA